MAVGQAREEIRPRQRAGVGIGHIDLDLRDHHEHHGGQHGGAVGVEEFAEAGQVHMGRIDRLGQRCAILEHQQGEQGAGQHLEHAQHDPARAGDQHAQVPAQAARSAGRVARRHEAQKVDLFADLGDQGHTDRGGRAKGQHVEAAASAVGARELQQLARQLRTLDHDRDEGQGHQAQPERLGQHLDAADQGHAMRHQRHHHQCAGQVAEPQRQAEIQLQRIRHDRRFEREQDEGERGVDEGRDGRADVTEAGAAREQVHVDAVARRVVADRQAGQEDDQPDRDDCPEGVDEAIVNCDGAADRLEHQEGDGAEGGIRDPEHRPFAEGARREAQRIILDGLVGHPGIVVAPDLDDALYRFGAGRVPFWCSGAHDPGKSEKPDVNMQLACPPAGRAGARLALQSRASNTGVTLPTSSPMPAVIFERPCGQTG